MGSKLLEKRIEEIRKRKKKLLEDIKLLIDDALNGLDELDDFMKILNFLKFELLQWSRTRWGSIKIEWTCQEILSINSTYVEEPREPQMKLLYLFCFNFFFFDGLFIFLVLVFGFAGAFLVLRNEISVRIIKVATANHKRQNEEKVTAKHFSPHCFISKYIEASTRTKLR